MEEMRWFPSKFFSCYTMFYDVTVTS